MKIKITNSTVNFIAVFMTLLYAFATRSVFAGLLFRSQVQLLLFYGITYGCLFFNFMNRFHRHGRYLFVPKGLWTISLVFLVIFLGLWITGDTYSLLYYGMALLLPFSMRSEIIEAKFPVKCFAGMAAFFSLGCFLNFLVPAVYRNFVFPLFSESAQKSLMGIENISGGSVYFAGFTSQVGYTSFFIALGIGAVFCFKNIIFKGLTYPIILFMCAGMLLTGKRGPIVFLVVALTIVYFLDGNGREKIVRIFKIAFMIIGAYVALMMIAKISHMPGIVRIYETINEFLGSGSVEDVGRAQLYQQALLYFEEHPLLGIGWTNFRRLYSFRSTHVHNIYLQLLCETGLCGFLVFVIFFINNILRTIKKERKSRRYGTQIENNWMKFSLFIQLYFLIYGITGNPLYDIEETIFYFFAIGISYLPFMEKNDNSTGETI